MSSPYSSLPETAFWRPAVANRHIFDLIDVSSHEPIDANTKVATAGSCFAQHIGRHLRRRNACFLDLEPAPDFLSPEQAHRHGFGILSCRYGNIYTARQLLQLAQECQGLRTPTERVWRKNDRFYDALRPSVDPVGHASAEDVLSLREQHLQKVRQLLCQADLFIFTLGLTEAWESREDGTVYPSAPGTIAGTFDARKYSFHNFRYNEVLADMLAFWALLREQNPSIRLLLTVSPVPLTATASGEHVLVATTQSKATLRAVAGDLAASEKGISYFPAYELIASHPARGSFFNPDLRTVNEVGVNFVMSHFFRGSGVPAVGVIESPDQDPDDGDLICDEEALDPAEEPANEQSGRCRSL